MKTRVSLARSLTVAPLLAGGDRRGIGRADEVAEMVLENTKLFPGLIRGMWHKDALVRMRAADAAEKVTRTNRGLLRPHKRALLGLLNQATEQELRWHLAVMIPRLVLNDEERQLVMSVLQSYLEDRSSIVKTFALQGLADLAREDPRIRPGVIELLLDATRNGTAAMKARSRKLLVDLVED